MPPRLIHSALLLALLASASPAQAQVVLPSEVMLSRYGLVQAWWNQATTSPTRDKIQHLVVDEEMVYVQSSSGIVTAFDAETGQRRWAVQVGRQDDPSHPAASNAQLVLITIGAKLYALDKARGDIIWEIRVPGLPSTSPSVDDLHVYVGSMDGRVYAFNLDRIRRLYAEGRLPQWSYQALEWEFQAPAAIVTPPLPVQLETGRSVNFADVEGSLYSVTALRRALRFQFETDAAASAALSQSNGLLLMPSQDFELYCINLVANGALQWRFLSSAPIRRKAVVIDEDVFVTPQAAGLYCLSVESGDQKWWRPRLERFLAATSRLVYASDEIGNVIILSRRTGSIVGGLPLRGFSVRVANDRTDRLYLATQTGLVVCLREADQSLPLFHMFPESRPILPEFAPEEADEQPAEDAAETE